MSVAREDRGMYQCFVRNEYEMAQGIAELRLGGEFLCFACRFFFFFYIAARYVAPPTEENRLAE